MGETVEERIRAAGEAAMRAELAKIQAEQNGLGQLQQEKDTLESEIVDAADRGDWDKITELKARLRVKEAELEQAIETPKREARAKERAELEAQAEPIATQLIELMRAPTQNAAKIAALQEQLKPLQEKMNE